MTQTHQIAAELLPLATPIGDLKPLPGNPRKGDVTAVARSYEKFGQLKPIVAKSDGTVVGGNHQLAAAKQLGWTHIAVTRFAGDDITAKAFALADNRTAELGSYDTGLLAELISEVGQHDADLLTAAGYDAADIDKLADELTDADTDAVDFDAVFEVVITCDSEDDQAALLERFLNEGLKVRGMLV